MAEETNQPQSERGKNRRERVDFARSRDILDVANELQMELFRSGRDYRWKEHDSMVISPDKNLWKWYSRNTGGDVITLVETMKEINFNQAIDYLNDGSFKEFTAVERGVEPFSYYLQPYERPFNEAREYLREQRGLSDETIDFFLEKGVLAQANAMLNNSIEPVVVFKTLSSDEIVGATLQGITENWEKWPERGYAKNIVRNSDGMNGLHVDIGEPKRLVFTESPIDLMSYYELNKDNLTDVRLVSMDGLKESIVGNHLAHLQSELSGRPLRWSREELAEGLQTAIDNQYFTDGKHADMITLAVDNDAAGREFVDSLTAKGAAVVADLPPLKEGQDKTDWNDALKNPSVDNSRLGRARRKLDRLNGEFLDNTQAVYDHSAMANGQPMNADEPYQRRESEVVEDYEKQVDELISEITKDDTNYYLWHDETLSNLKAGEAIIEEFHNSLEDTRYQIAGSTLYVEDSANDGATGYLSIEGHALDDNGIHDYLSDKGFSDAEKVEFLTKLQAELPEIWDKVLNHYDEQLENIVEKYGLTEEVASEVKEKAPEKTQEHAVSEKQKKDETNIGGLSEQAQEAAPLPEAIESQPLKDLSPSQSESHSLLYFTIEKPKKSIYKDNYHPIKPHELNKLNHHAENLQNAAQWYLENLSDTTLHYFYQKQGKQYNISIDFKQYHFMHLTGLYPLKKGQTAIKTLHDFAKGNGNYDNIMIANKDAAFQKIKVLPDLKAIMETDSFYFDQVEDIPKLHSLSMEQAVKSDDKDVLLAFSSNNENVYPASLQELTDELRLQTENSQHQNIILGVYQERDGIVLNFLSMRIS